MTLFNRIFKRESVTYAPQALSSAEQAKQDYEAWLNFYNNPTNIEQIKANEEVLPDEEELPFEERSDYLYGSSPLAREIADKMLKDDDYKAAVDYWQLQYANHPEYVKRIEQQPHYYYMSELAQQAKKELGYISRYINEPVKIVQPSDYQQTVDTIKAYEITKEQLSNPTSEMAQKYSADLKQQMLLQIEKSLPQLNNLVNQVSQEHFIAFKYNMDLETYQDLKTFYEKTSSAKTKHLETAEQAQEALGALQQNRDELVKRLLNLDTEDIDYESYEYGIQCQLLEIDLNQKAIEQFKLQLPEEPKHISEMTL